MINSVLWNRRLTFDQICEWRGGKDVACAFRDVMGRGSSSPHSPRFSARAQANITAMGEWLGFHFEENMLAFHEINRRMKLEPALTLDWKMRTLEPVSDQTIGRYLTALSTAERTRSTKSAVDALYRFGYLSRES
jgi:hypothetical protein